MNLEPAPRLSKTVFLLIDAGLLLTAFIIAYFAKDPFAPLPFISTVLFVGAAGVVGLIPFLVDYAADSAEYVQQEREKVAEQVQRLHAASESLNRAAAHIKAVEEAVHKTAHAAENLPYRMQEKLAEFNAQFAQTEDEEKERLNEELATLRLAESERLQTIADKIHKSATELSTLETTTRKQIAALQEAATKLDDKLKSTLSKITELSITIASAPRPEPPAPRAENKPVSMPTRAEPVAPVVETKPEPAPSPAPANFEPVEATRPEPVEGVVESVAVVETTPAPVAEPKLKKARAPRKPRPEETLAAMSEPVADSASESSQSDTPDENATAEAAPRPEASVSSDGATRLLATAYIGIGNKLYLRGDGPGLSWDKGVPMQFVSIGKWGWATDDATAPIACKLYKNDETPALSGEVFLEPGKHVEVTALF
ncbi:MAG: hypothetical protein PSV13_06905 [Lacunisphaera sp.]|nr:hypothetical protein [Lacunisphaera sp.]